MKRRKAGIERRLKLFLSVSSVLIFIFIALLLNGNVDKEKWRISSHGQSSFTELSIFPGLSFLREGQPLKELNNTATINQKKETCFPEITKENVIAPLFIKKQSRSKKLKTFCNTSNKRLVICLLISILLHSLLLTSLFISQKIKEEAKNKLISVEYDSGGSGGAPKKPEISDDILDHTKSDTRSILLEKVVSVAMTNQQQNENVGLGTGTGTGIGGLGSGLETEIIPFAAVEIKPTAISTPPPEYPTLARDAEVEGIVGVSIIIDEIGNVARARVIKPLQELLDSTAVQQVRKWKFTPAMQRDKPIKVCMEIPIRFTLK
ncbi:MAG: energy transducer TonB [bacterium]|nr:energy transducer TonB [bacterium]